MSKRIKAFGLLLVFFIISTVVCTPFQSFATLPDEVRLFTGQQKQVDFAMPVGAQVTVNHPDIVKVNGKSENSFHLHLNHPILFESASIGTTEMQVKLFGTIPIKKFKVNVVPDLKVIPGGQTIGVKMKSAGIMIVGHHLVQVAKDRKQSPGEQAEIKLGDLIVKMDGVPLNDVAKVSELVKRAGKSNTPIELTIRRDGKELIKSITPMFDIEDKAYRLGLYIRDSAAGVGTLTFYAPDQGVYGALGHVITDMDTQVPIEVGEGKIVHSNVTSISKGHQGIPGEKRAHFFKENKVLGTIEANTNFGIFGQMSEAPQYSAIQEAMPVAFANEVQPGPAQILTVIEGHKVERFDIRIAHVSSQTSPETKGMVIKVTDPELIRKTGGIVQGMSGSPIIQNGKVVGAVTHVFVNDPTSGYGCFIEWMLQDAGVMISPQAEHRAS